MLSKNIEAALNKQIRIEAESSQIYLSMACWAEVQGLEDILPPGEIEHPVVVVIVFYFTQIC